MTAAAFTRPCDRCCRVTLNENVDSQKRGAENAKLFPAENLSLLIMLEENLIQIAGVVDTAEAEMLQECGIRYLGFPLRLPVHREDLTEEEAAAIIKSLAPPVFGVLITYLDKANEIVGFSHALGARVVQLHGDIDPDELKRLKTLDQNLTVIKSLVIGMRDARVLEATVNELSPLVDAFITDTFDPKTGASGATGKTHDWHVSRRLVELANRPIILAGGLTPENVKRAILEVQPAGVDSHTGVEDSVGRKSREKIRKFVSEAREAFEIVKPK
jgi:phosphoribosylanthranilate isomerase